MGRRNQVTVEASDFMCRCDKKNIKRCDKVLARAREIVDHSHPCENDLEFVNRMIYWLAMEGDLGFGADQWGGVFVKPFEQPDEESRYMVKEPACIRCDNMVDGLAAAIVFYFEGKTR